MKSNYYTILAKFQARPGKEQELKERLSALIAPTLKEEGCVNYVLHQDRDNSAQFMFYENWVNEESFLKHTKSAHIQQWKAEKDDLVLSDNLSFWKAVSK